MLYDAVAILASAEGAAALADRPGGQGLRHRRPRPLQVHRLHRRTPRRCSRPPASPTELDDGYVALDKRASATTFVERCRNVRHWARSVPAASPDGA